MAVIPISNRQARLKPFRPQDRIEREPISAQLGLTGILAGTAIVAGSVVGLLLYDSGRPFATGALPQAAPPPLVISVEPMPADDPQPR